VNPSIDNLPAARAVVIHAHFHASVVGEQTVFGPTGRMENGQRLVLLDQIQSWCSDTRTKVTIKPVIDLNTPLTAQGYKIPADIREQVQLRDRTCVFPRCTRPPAAATWTTSSSTTTTPRQRAGPSPGPRAPTTSPACAGSTTG
jgi:hypothetical protein